VRESTLGGLFVFAAAAGFGTIGIFGEVAAAIGLELSTLLPTRFALATLLIVGIGRVRGWPLPSSRRAWATTFVLGVVYTGMTLAFFVSLRYLTAGLATVVLYTYPALVVVVSMVAMDEAITARKVVALVLTTLGVGLVVGADGAVAAPLGVGLALVAALCYALYTAGSRAVSPSISPAELTVGVLAGTTVSMLAYGLLDGGLALPSGTAEWGVVLGLALVSTVIPHVLFYQGVSRLEAGRVGIISTVEPVVTVVLGVLLLGETVTLSAAVGGALVLGAVLLVQRSSGDAEPAQSRSIVGD